MSTHAMAPNYSMPVINYCLTCICIPGECVLRYIKDINFLEKSEMCSGGVQPAVSVSTFS
jgi:hypothetical protein